MRVQAFKKLVISQFIAKGPTDYDMFVQLIHEKYPEPVILRIKPNGKDAIDLEFTDLSQLYYFTKLIMKFVKFASKIDISESINMEE